MKNDQFRSDFMKTFSEIAGNNFSDERVDNAITALSEEYRDMVTDTFDRFWRSSAGGYSANSNFEGSVSELREFFSERRNYIMKYVENHLSAGS